jgi:SpoU rRNA methylase family enzyme
MSDAQSGVLMLRKQQPSWNVEELTDAEISAAIRYLDPSPIINGGSEEISNAIRNIDPDLNAKTVQEDKRTALVIFLTALVILFYGLLFVWCHR